MRCDWAGAPSKIMTRAMSIQSLYDDHIPDGTRETQRDHLTIFERPVPSLPRRSVKGLDDHEGLVRLFPFPGWRVWHRGQRNCPNAVAMPNNDFPSSSVSLPPITAVAYIFLLMLDGPSPHRNTRFSVALNSQVDSCRRQGLGAQVGEVHRYLELAKASG